MRKNFKNNNKNLNSVYINFVYINILSTKKMTYAKFH